MKRRRREEEDEEDGLKTMEERYNGLGDYIKMSCFPLVGACFKRANRLPDHSRLLSDQTLLIYDADQTDSKNGEHGIRQSGNWKVIMKGVQLRKLRKLQAIKQSFKIIAKTVFRDVVCAELRTT